MRQATKKNPVGGVISSSWAGLLLGRVEAHLKAFSKPCKVRFQAPPRCRTLRRFQTLVHVSGSQQPFDLGHSLQVYR